jgi:glucokinase
MKTSDLKNSVKTRLQNQLHVLNEVRRRQFISNAELSRIFKVPAASTLRILLGLEALGCIRKSKTYKEKKRVGKPAVYFEISPDFGGVITVDSGMLFTRFAVIDYSGKISHYKELKTNEMLPAYAETVAEEIKALVRKSGISEDRIALVTGISGGISKDCLRTVFLPENYDLKERLESLLDLEVYMENDANLAVIAEKHDASIYAPTSILCVLDRLEIGTGIVIDGKLYRGFNGVAGEIYRYSKGRQEEGVADILASNNFKKLFPDVSELTGIKELYRMLEDQAARGDSTAKNLIAEIIDKFTFEFIRLSRMLDPEYFIFAGEISKTGKAFQDELLDNIRRNRQNKSNYSNMPKIIFSRLGDKSVLTGAGYFGFNILDSRLLAEQQEAVNNNTKQIIQYL